MPRPSTIMTPREQLRCRMPPGPRAHRSRGAWPDPSRWPPSSGPPPPLRPSSARGGGVGRAALTARGGARCQARRPPRLVSHRGGRGARIPRLRFRLELTAPAGAVGTLRLGGACVRPQSKAIADGIAVGDGGEDEMLESCAGATSFGDFAFPPSGHGSIWWSPRSLASSGVDLGAGAGRRRPRGVAAVQRRRPPPDIVPPAPWRQHVPGHARGAVGWSWSDPAGW